MDKPGESDKLTKPVMTMMIVIIMLAVVVSILPTPPTPQYTCPICGEKFFTYDELYSHFTTEHPAVDIEIIWD